MPVATLVTNVKIRDVKQFSTSLSKACSAAWSANDPEGINTSSSVIFNESLNFEGTHEPAFLLTFKTLENAATAKRDSFAKALGAFFEKSLGIPQARGYILFRILANNEIAMDGITYETFLSQQPK
ncbi:hypothetical protein C8J57DRAFT_1302230 [Mycena rebaudengoi]|nr:hypothetical protein C8J57DRAFT_1302230 [Mycena rebaudengoi]